MYASGPYYSQKIIDNAIVPRWKYFLMRMMFWKYKEYRKGQVRFLWRIK